MIVISKPTAEEQAAEDFDPIPCIALASGDTRITEFKLALPAERLGYTGYMAVFYIEHDARMDGCYVRYSQLIPPTRLPLTSPLNTLAGDEVHVLLRR